MNKVVGLKAAREDDLIDFCNDTTQSIGDLIMDTSAKAVMVAILADDGEARSIYFVRVHAGSAAIIGCVELLKAMILEDAGYHEEPLPSGA